MAVPSHIRGLLPFDPQQTLKLNTSNFMQATQKSDYDYIQSQFLTAEKKCLQAWEVSTDDLFLLDRIYMLSSALPYYQTRGLVRKTMFSDLETTIIQSSITENLHSQIEKCPTQILNNNLQKKEEILDIPFEPCDTKRETTIKGTKNGNSSSFLPYNNEDLSKTNVNISQNKLARNHHKRFPNENQITTESVDFSETNGHRSSSSSLSRASSKSHLTSPQGNNIHQKGNRSPKNYDGTNLSKSVSGLISPRNTIGIVPLKNINRVSPRCQSELHTPIHDNALNPVLQVSYDVVFGDGNYVIKKSDLPIVEHFHNQLEKEVLQPWTNSNERKVIAKVGGKYYRGNSMVKSRKEGSVYIKLVDVGWFLDVFPNQSDIELYIAPEKYKKTKPLSFQINMDFSHHIARNQCVNIVETGKTDENKVKNVLVKKIYPLNETSPSNAISDPSVPQNFQSVNKPNNNQNLVKPKPVSKENYQFRGTPMTQEENIQLNTPKSVVWIQQDEVCPNVHLVQDVEYYAVFEEWQKLAINHPLEINPNIGDFYMKEVENEWCRTKVVSVNPLKVYFIDFGTVEPVNSVNDLRILPVKMSEKMPMAYKIKFANPQHNEEEYNFGDSFLITVIESNNSILTVLKDKEKMPCQASPNTAPSHDQTKNFFKNYPISLISPLELQILVEVTFVQEDPDCKDVLWVQESQCLELMTEWMVLGNAQTQTFDHNPEIGEYCIHFYEEIWCRGRVTCSAPLTLFYIDYGNSEPVNLTELKVLPEKMAHIRPLAHKIRFQNPSNSKLSLDFGQVLTITPVQYDATANLHLVSNGSESGQEDTVKSRVYALPVVNLELKKPVEVLWLGIDEFDHSFVWVQDVSQIEKLAVVISIMETNNMGTSNINFSETPKVGQMWAKLYEDVWCRAKVVESNPLTIFYVDYGNIEVVTQVSDLKVLQQFVSQLPGLALRIHLDNELKTPLEYGSVFQIVPTSFSNNVYSVTVPS